jgi:hypothetical protein
MSYKNKEDQAASARRHYEANKEKMKARAVEHRRNNRKKIQAIIQDAKSVPCADCGIKYPYYVMDFDHRGDKEFNIGGFSKAQVHTAEKILAEIAKCDVVCSNCHRERSYGSLVVRN